MARPRNPNRRWEKRRSGAKTNRRLTRQTRKLLGKHYANRYHTRRG